MEKTKVTLNTADGYRATIQTRQHVYHADEPESAGGTDTAVTPMEMAMGALGACVVVTIQMYAKRKGWPLEGIEIELDAERFNGKEYEGYEGDERYVHEIREAITLHGDLDETQRNRLMEIAEICPVSRLIKTPTFYIQELLDAEKE